MANFVKQHIVCLGGGIGTVNLIKGLKKYTSNITVVVSMADDGGSAGRLRKLYDVPPPGDLVNCIEALSDAKPLMKDLLTFRFKGNRYGGNFSLPGHKLGNLMLTAASALTEDFDEALRFMQDLFKVKGEILPATMESVRIKALTVDGVTVDGEQNIDLGKYEGKKILEKVFLMPKNAKANSKVIEALKRADIIIAGPGDLYTTILPVLLIKNIRDAIKSSKANKIFVINVANKPFETPKYSTSDYIRAITKHCQEKLFDVFLANDNTTTKIPRQYKYEYVPIKKDTYNGLLKTGDLVNSGFPLYHDSGKLAAFLKKHV